MAAMKMGSSVEGFAEGFLAGTGRLGRVAAPEARNESMTSPALPFLLEAVPDPVDFALPGVLSLRAFSALGRGRLSGLPLSAQLSTKRKRFTYWSKRPRCRPFV
jgi:hypothetical protein